VTKNSGGYRLSAPGFYRTASGLHRQYSPPACGKVIVTAALPKTPEKEFRAVFEGELCKKPEPFTQAYGTINDRYKRCILKKWQKNEKC
jgi:hypothetical protein